MTNQEKQNNQPTRGYNVVHEKMIPIAITVLVLIAVGMIVLAVGIGTGWIYAG